MFSAVRTYRFTWHATPCERPRTAMRTVAKRVGNGPNSIYFSENDLRRYRNRFIPPTADEPHLLYAAPLRT